MSNRPTPLTDDEIMPVANGAGAWMHVVSADFARDLESKLAHARVALKLIAGKNSMLRSYTAEEAASDAKQALARIDGNA